MFNSIINYYQQFENILAYGFIGIIVVGITKFFFHNSNIKNNNIKYLWNY